MNMYVLILLTLPGFNLLGGGGGRLILPQTLQLPPKNANELLIQEPRVSGYTNKILVLIAGSDLVAVY